MTLEDVWIAIQGNTMFDPETRRRLQQIDELFASISGREHKERWTFEAVRSDPMWETARSLARDLLTFLGESRDDRHLLGNV